MEKKQAAKSVPPREKQVRAKTELGEEEGLEEYDDEEEDYDVDDGLEDDDEAAAAAGGVPRWDGHAPWQSSQWGDGEEADDDEGALAAEGDDDEGPWAEDENDESVHGREEWVDMVLPPGESAVG